MSGRQEAIAAVKAVIRHIEPQPVSVESLLDAIPPSVLARLAIERGGMTGAESHHDSICSWRIWTEHEDLFDTEPECDCQPVYRLTDGAQP